MKNVDNKYDVIIVGGGPAGAFCAYELLQKNPGKKILIIERGKSIKKRSCPQAEFGSKCVNCKPYCSITNGFAGAGAFSDGKLSLYNTEDDDIYVGGNLHKYIGVNKTKKLIDYTDSIYLNFEASTTVQGMEHPEKIGKIRKNAENAGLELINVPIRHLGTDKSRILYEKLQKYLQDNGVKIFFENVVKDLLIEDNKIYGVKFISSNLIGEEECEMTLTAEKVVLAVGRSGADWLLNMCNKHMIKSTPAVLDIGIRYELPDEVMQEINEYLYEGKIKGKPAPFHDEVRTFCQNPSGIVSIEVYDSGIKLVNGHSYKDKKSTNTNLALLVSVNLKDLEDPMKYARNIAKNVNALTNGSVIVQRLGDIKSGKRTWPAELEKNSVEPTLKAAVPGDLSLGMPYRVIVDLLKFIELMDKVAPGFASDDNLIYGPEIKFYSNRVELTQNFETTVKGLYAIGDGCGLTRGLMQASASGVQLARNLFKK